MRVLNNVAHLLGRASEPVVRSASASANQLKVAAVATTVISLLAGLYYLFTRCFANKPVHVAQGSASNDPAVTQVAKNIISPNGGVVNNAPILPPEETLESIIYPLEDFNKFISEHVHYQLNNKIEQIVKVEDKTKLVSALKKLFADQKDPYSKYFVLYSLKLALLDKELTLDFVNAFIDLPALAEDDSMIVECLQRNLLPLELAEKLYGRLSNDFDRLKFIKGALFKQENLFAKKGFENELLLYQYYYEARSFEEKKNLILQLDHPFFKEKLVIDLLMSHDNSPEKISQFSAFKIPVQGELMELSSNIFQYDYKENMRKMHKAQFGGNEEIYLPSQDKKNAYRSNDFEGISFIPESVKAFMKFQQALAEKNYDACFECLPQLNLPRSTVLHNAFNCFFSSLKEEGKKFSLSEVVGKEFKNSALLEHLSEFVEEEATLEALNKLKTELEAQQEQLEKDDSPIDLKPFEKLYRTSFDQFKKSLLDQLDGNFRALYYEKISLRTDPIQKCRLAKKMIQEQISLGNLHHAFYISTMIFKELIKSDLSEKVAQELITLPPPPNLCSLTDKVEDFRAATLLIHLIPHSYTRLQAALKYFGSLKFNLNEEQIRELDPRLLGMDRVAKADEKNFEHLLDGFNSLSSELQLQIYAEMVRGLFSPDCNISHELRLRFFQEIKTPASISSRLAIVEIIAKSKDPLELLESSPFAVEELCFDDYNKTRILEEVLKKGDKQVEKLMNIQSFSPQELTSLISRKAGFSLYQAERSIDLLKALNLFSYVSDEQWITLAENRNLLRILLEEVEKSEYLASLLVFRFIEEDDIQSALHAFSSIKDPKKREQFGAFLIESEQMGEDEILDFYEKYPDLLVHFRPDKMMNKSTNLKERYEKLLSLTSDREVKEGILKCALAAAKREYSQENVIHFMTLYLSNKEIDKKPDEIQRALDCYLHYLVNEINFPKDQNGDTATLACEFQDIFEIPSQKRVDRYKEVTEQLGFKNKRFSL